MLQRIQSVLLLISAIGMGLFLGFNSWEYTANNQSVLVNSFHIVHFKGTLAAFEKSIYYEAVLAVLSIILSVFTIFQYKDRVRQMLFVALNSLLIGVCMAVMVYHVKYDAMALMPGSENGEFTYGIYAGFAALAANWLANRFIRKDEKLVKSADRMR